MTDGDIRIDLTEYRAICPYLVGVCISALDTLFARSSESSTAVIRPVCSVQEWVLDVWTRRMDYALFLTTQSLERTAT